MKELIVLVATIATLGFISCNHAQKDAEKATQDSIVEAARLDSVQPSKPPPPTPWNK